MADITIIGGGIIGIATALEVLRTWPGLSVQVLEKEQTLAMHQTGRNSGVIHAGIYYPPGSLKAQFCSQGLVATERFCADYGIAHEQTGKLLVATTAMELERLNALHVQAHANRLDVRLISGEELLELEPNITGLGALLSPKTGIVDYVAIVEQLARLFTDRGGQIFFGATVTELSESRNDVNIALANGEGLRSRYLISCAGLQADRLAALCGVGGDFAIVPFKGEYFRLSSKHDTIVNHLIYPVPDPNLPFLGIHLTRMIGGFVTVGPNAVLSFARERYGKFAIDWHDIASMGRFPGFWNTVGANFSTGVAEFSNSFSRRRYLSACQKYCPSLELNDLKAHPAGIRAQAVMRDGTLVHDFLVRHTKRTIHICNAPSPAATSAFPIAEHICATVAANFFPKEMTHAV
jgi:L-2-hydroxyglutarate oxidase